MKKFRTAVEQEVARNMAEIFAASPDPVEVRRVTGRRRDSQIENPIPSGY